MTTRMEVVGESVEAYRLHKIHIKGIVRNGILPLLQYYRRILFQMVKSPHQRARRLGK